MIFTQRALWGNNGLLRKAGIFPLNVEQREKELKLRRSMLKIHQIIGYLTLAGMVTQGFLEVNFIIIGKEVCTTHIKLSAT